MTLEEIKKRIAHIEQTKFDDEVAHSMEDSLWGDVLLAIASGAENPTELAAEVLKTSDIEFSRWYA